MQLLTRCSTPSLALLFQGFHQPCLDVLRNFLRLHSFEYLNGLLGRVADDPAIGTFVDMPLELGPEARIQSVVEKVAHFRQELLTGKQTRRPPCA